VIEGSEALPEPDMNNSTSIKFKYDLLSSSIAGVVLSIVLLLCLKQAFPPSGVPNKVPLVLSIGSAIGLIFLSYKVLVPALFDRTALELNGEQMVNNISKLTIKWNNVKSIRQVRFGASAKGGVAIDLLNTSAFTNHLNLVQMPFCYITDVFYGTPLVMDLEYISGKRSEIFDAMQSCLHKTKAKVRAEAEHERG